MEKNILQGLINLGLSQREIARKLGISQTNIRYWLNKHDLKTINPIGQKTGNTKICNDCKEELSISEFYVSKGKVRVRCKNCENKIAHEKQKATKLKIIQLKGGKCENCNLTLEQSHRSVFEIHHIDPLIKDNNFKSIKSWSWEKIEKELQTCKLLCANCHRIEHAKIGNKD